MAALERLGPWCGVTEVPTWGLLSMTSTGTFGFFMETQGSEFFLDRNSGFPYGSLLVSLLNPAVPIPTRRASIPSPLNFDSLRAA